ncbi:MAG: flagellar biosynthesis protein FlhF [Desulfobacterales bacterium]|nr:flagellar biosynthesis protein FlhF [Desulfobacterales bacterium]
MEVKKYTAKTINEAIAKIKEELGSDAMILSTKRIPKGPKDPYGDDLFEVTAAKNPVKEENIKPTESFIKKSPKFTEYFNGLLESEIEDVTSLIGKRSSEEEIDDYSDKTWNVLRNEILTIKDMIFLMNQSGGLPEFLHVHPEALNIYTMLVKSGISEKRSQQFVKKGIEGLNSKTSDPKALSKNVIKEIILSFSVTNPFEPNSEKRYIAAFTGPTGVGKTTTIAKIAAELCIKQKRSVGLISIDSYRIGAVEQLKTYAAIMGIPCLAAFSSQDLQLAAKKLQNKEIILIDTAGHSHLDNERMNELGRIMDANLSISNHLLLSTTIRDSDMKDASENFSILKPKTYIFTKIDETKKRGCIIDQVLDLKMPISFITNGQKVPEDIMPATKNNVLKIILND